MTRITVRPATLADCEHVYGWSCAPDARAVSKDSRHVSFADHARWFEARLAARSPTWIVEEARAPVGVIRLDGEPARISVALARHARGRGIGRRAIGLVTRAWSRPIVAEVALANEPSKSCFEACGFVAVGSHEAFLTYHWSP